MEYIVLHLLEHTNSPYIILLGKIRIMFSTGLFHITESKVTVNRASGDKTVVRQGNTHPNLTASYTNKNHQ